MFVVPNERRQDLHRPPTPTPARAPGSVESEPEASNVVLAGEARFVPLSTTACLMLYRLVLGLPVVDDLLRSELDRHPASHVVAEFREHLRRLC